MLIINGKHIKKSQSNEIYELFICRGKYSIDEKIAAFIDGLISDDIEHEYSGVTQFKRRVYEALSGTRPHLLIADVHPDYVGPYQIAMTGNRTMDYAAANALAKTKYGRTPDHFTWHHAEGIKKIGGRYYCNMYLIRSSYHNTVRHSGGVKEYEIKTGTKYN